MKTRIIIFLAGLLAVLLVAGYFLLEDYQFQKSEAKRQKQNVEVLNKNYRSYKNAYGQQVAAVEALTYTAAELKTNEEKLLKEIQALKLKPKNVVSAAQVNTVTTAQIQAPVIVRDSVQCFEYQDEFNKVNGCLRGQFAELEIETRDSLTTVVSRIPKHRFLWWTWGVKAIELTITAKNPGTKFEYLKYIELKK